MYLFGIGRRRLSAVLVVLVGTIVLLWLFRVPILQAASSFLVCPDALSRVDAAYILGGSAEDRGAEAARLLRDGITSEAVFLGSQVPAVLIALGDSIMESELTMAAAERHGGSADSMRLLPKGTSTFEEFVAIRKDATEHGYGRIMIVSNSFHLRRLRMLRSPIEEDGVVVLLRNCHNSRFDEERWWTSEEGLIMLNNEYVKLVYYLLRY